MRAIFAAAALSLAACADDGPGAPTAPLTSTTAITPCSPSTDCAAAGPDFECRDGFCMPPAADAAVEDAQVQDAAGGDPDPDGDAG